MNSSMISRAATKARNHERRTVFLVSCFRVFVADVSVLALLLGVGLAQSASPGFDIVLRHGTVVDGTGLSRYRADVAIADGLIAKVGDLAAEHAATDIDATSLFVAPGFINIHSHASPDALARAENMLTQGVTTEILNPDGSGSADLPEQLARAAGADLALNIGGYIGFNSVWSQVMGATDRRATPEDVERMRALVVSGLEHGAWGVSAGLDYKRRITPKSKRWSASSRPPRSGARTSPITIG
jgi:N-acyl-D-amino-acid deacylase